jgi:hypothetical protein
MPAFPVLGAAVAARVACALVSRLAGGGVETVTTIGAADTTVAVAVADLVGSAVDFAVMVIVPPAGTVEEFVKVAATPLAVCAVMVPQLGVPQLRVQSAPPGVASLATNAVKCVERAAPEVWT